MQAAETGTESSEILAPGLEPKPNTAGADQLRSSGPQPTDNGQPKVLPSQPADNNGQSQASDSQPKAHGDSNGQLPKSDSDDKTQSRAHTPVKSGHPDADEKKEDEEDDGQASLPDRQGGPKPAHKDSPSSTPSSTTSGAAASSHSHTHPTKKKTADAKQPPDPQFDLANRLLAQITNYLDDTPYRTLRTQLVAQPPASVAPYDEKKAISSLPTMTYDQLTRLVLVPAVKVKAELLKKTQEELAKRNKKINDIYQHLLEKKLLSPAEPGDNETKHRDYCDIDTILQLGDGLLPDDGILGSWSGKLNAFFVECFTNAIINPHTTVIDLAVEELRETKAPKYRDQVIKLSRERLNKKLEDNFTSAQSTMPEREYYFLNQIDLQILTTAPSHQQDTIFIVSGIGNRAMIRLTIANQLNALMRNKIREVTLYLPLDGQFAKLPTQLIAALYLEEIDRRVYHFKSFSFAYVTPADAQLKVEDFPHLIYFKNAVERYNENRRKHDDDVQNGAFKRLWQPLSPPSPTDEDDRKAVEPPPTLQTLMTHLTTWREAIRENKGRAVISPLEDPLVKNFDKSQLSYAELTQFFAALTAADAANLRGELGAGNDLTDFYKHVQTQLQKRQGELSYPLHLPDMGPSDDAKAAASQRRPSSIASFIDHLPDPWLSFFMTSLLAISRYSSPHKEYAITKLMRQWWPIFITLNTDQLSELSQKIAAHSDPLLQGIRRALNRFRVAQNKEAKNPTSETVKLQQKQQKAMQNAQMETKAIADQLLTLNLETKEVKGKIPQKTSDALLVFSTPQLQLLQTYSVADGAPQNPIWAELAAIGPKEIATYYPFANIADYLIQLGIIQANEKETAIRFLDEMRLYGGGTFLIKLTGMPIPQERDKIQRLRLLTSWFHHAKKREGAARVLDEEKFLQYSFSYFTAEAKNKDKIATENNLKKLLQPEGIKGFINAGIPLPATYQLTDDDTDTLFTLVPEYPIKRINLSYFEEEINAEEEQKKEKAKQEAAAQKAKGATVTSAPSKEKSSEKEKDNEKKSEVKNTQAAKIVQVKALAAPLDNPMTEMNSSNARLPNLIADIKAELAKETPQAMPIMMHVPGHWVRGILSITKEADEKGQCVLTVTDSLTCNPTYELYLVKGGQLLMAEAQKVGLTLSLSFAYTYQSEHTQPRGNYYSCGHLSFQGLLRTYRTASPLQDHERDAKQAAQTTIIKANQLPRLHDAVIQAIAELTTTDEERALIAQQNLALPSSSWTASLWGGRKEPDLVSVSLSSTSSQPKGLASTTPSTSSPASLQQKSPQAEHDSKQGPLDSSTTSTPQHSSSVTKRMPEPTRRPHQSASSSSSATQLLQLDGEQMLDRYFGPGAASFPYSGKSLQRPASGSGVKPNTAGATPGSTPQPGGATKAL